MNLLRSLLRVAALLLPGLLVAAPASIYRNTFDDASALDGWLLSHGAEGGSVAVENGHLTLRGAPFSYRGARVALPLATILGRPGPFLSGELAPSHITWTFNLSYEDGPGGTPNTGFRIHPVATGSDPDTEGTFSYVLRGGIYPDDQITFDRGFAPGAAAAGSDWHPAHLFRTHGLAPSPRHGAVRIDCYPNSGYNVLWRVHLQESDSPPNPERLARSEARTYETTPYATGADIGFTHFIIEAQNGGVVRIDNLTVTTYATGIDDNRGPVQRIVPPPGFTLSGTDNVQIVFGDPPIPLPPLASSGLPVAWRMHSGPGVIENGMLRSTGAGVIQFSGDQPGDDSYYPASYYFYLNVAPAPLSIQLSDLRQTYRDAPLPVGVTTHPADTPVRITYAGEDEPPRHAGDYPVLVTSDSPDYAGRAEGLLVIDRAPLDVAPVPVSRLVGQPNPAFALRYEGFRGDDTPADIDTPPTARTQATKTSRAGPYPITLSGGGDRDYRLQLATGVLDVENYAGTYEAILTAPETPDGAPLGKVSVTLSSTRPFLTGSIWPTGEKTSRPFSGILGDMQPDGFVAATIPLPRRSGESPGTLPRLRLMIDGDRLRAQLASSTDGIGFVILGVSEEGARRYQAAPRLVSPWSGSHTLSLRPSVPAGLPAPTKPVPAGPGHARATIQAANGALTITGRLPDGTALTSATRPDAAGRHRLFLRPHGPVRINSLVGRLDLLPHPSLAGRHHVPAESQTLFWSKAASPSGKPDKLYPQGYDALPLALTLDPWLPPVAAKRATAHNPARPAITLADRLGLAATTARVAILYPTIPDLGPSAANLPPAFAIDTRGNAILPGPAGQNPSRWQITFDPLRGTLGGSFILHHPPPPPAVKPVIVKKFTFSGVLRQPADPTDTLIGAAQVIWTDPQNTLPAESLEIRFLRAEDALPGSSAP